MRTGRPGAKREIGPVRELTEADIATLVPGARPRLPAAARFRDSHHMVARLFATGLKAKAVAAHTGYSLGRVITLSNDPAFQDLITTYREQVDEAFRESVDGFAEMALSNMAKAERMIGDKLDKADADEETLPTRDLVSIVSDRADRFGYGKRQTNVNLNADFASLLEKAIERSGKVIDAKPSERLRRI